MSPEAAAARIAELEARVARAAELEARVARVAELEARVAQVAELEARVARVAELEARVARVAELEEEVAALREALASSVSKNRELTAQLEVMLEKLRQDSSNSHKPPSSDGPGAAGRKGRRGKSKSKRKRGGQKGHRGARREMFEPGEVDTVVDLFPLRCSGCGYALPETPDRAPSRHQMVDLDLGRRHVTEWRRHDVCCPRCGTYTQADYDPAVIPASPFGPRLCATVVLLTGVYHLSRRQTARLFREVFGVPISVGSVSNIEARMTPALKPAAEEAARHVDDAPVKYADATTWLRAGVTMSLWTIASAGASVFRIFVDGKRRTIELLFGKRTGILVSDRASVFNFWVMVMRQVCWAHILRKFVAFSQRAGPAGRIGRALVDCTVLMFEYWHAFKAGALTRDELQTWMRPVQRHMEALLERAACANIPRLSGSCANILEHREALWTFLTHEGVEPTNNHAEQELRRFVMWRKNSYGCQSERGLRFAERMMTVVHTLRKQGLNVLGFLVRTLRAQQNGAPVPSLFAAAAA